MRVELRTRLRDDDGSTLLLTIFYTGLALIVVLLVVAVSSLYLERSRLFALADGAALAGAESFGLAAVDVGESGVVPRLEEQQVALAVEQYLAAAEPSTDFDDLTVIRATTLDGRSATVTLSASWRPAVVSVLVPAGFPIEVTSDARSVFG
ncbi:pilus assembly protein TadG-related protein [Agreia sp. COWG]|uniref:pilus assembly protein TadG-related protein n=1 Tax=Agreia sp. COWG TaxID=2773266 RepID=UPI00192520D6|nr:pilus assembly protein TadG-related protein [Agreia sp. COWG]CAD6000968.1 Tad domain-containing protein [Agreia sp. COWG]